MRELRMGDTGDDVIILQTYLAKDPELYPAGIVNGRFGPMTTAAVKRFQARYGLPPVGRVGPLTLKKLNELMGSYNVLPSASSDTSSSDAQEQARLQSQASQLQDLLKSLQAQVLRGVSR